MNRSRRSRIAGLCTVLAGVLALALAGPLGSQPASAATPNVPAKFSAVIQNLRAGPHFCLDADIHTIRNGGTIELWGCNSGSQQVWSFVQVGDGSYEIHNGFAGNGFCLDADTNTIGRNGTKVQLWTCNHQSQQHWLIRQSGPTTYRIGNVAALPDFCLDADLNTIGSNGTKIQLWTCSDNDGQPQQDWTW